MKEVCGLLWAIFLLCVIAFTPSCSHSDIVQDPNELASQTLEFVPQKCIYRPILKINYINCSNELGTFHFQFEPSVASINDELNKNKTTSSKISFFPPGTTKIKIALPHQLIFVGMNIKITTDDFEFEIEKNKSRTLASENELIPSYFGHH